MATIIKIKRGAEESLPVLQLGELGFTTDTKKIYIGNGFGNTLIADSTLTKDYIHQIMMDYQKEEIKTGLLIPLYLYPTDPINNSVYNLLIDLKKSYHDVPVTVILNPSNGPGASTDANYVTIIERLKGAGITVLGYIPTDYTNISLSVVLQTIDSWIYFYPQINGLYIDEMTYDDNILHINYYRDIKKYAHGQLLYPVIGHSGQNMPRGYFDNKCMDVIVTYNSTSFPTESELKGNTDGGNASFSYTKRAGIVTQSSTLPVENFNLMRKYLGHIYITDDASPNPWDTLSVFLADMLRYLSLPIGSYIDGGLLE